MKLTLLKKAISGILIGILFSGGVAYAAITVGNTASGSGFTTSLSTSFTVPAGDNQILVAYTIGNNGPSMTYNGVSMTQLATGSANDTMYIFYLLNPTVGTANIVQSGGNQFRTTYAISYSGVKQQAPGTPVFAANSPSVVTTVANSFVQGLTRSSNNTASVSSPVTNRASFGSVAAIVGDITTTTAGSYTFNSGSGGGTTGAFELFEAPAPSTTQVSQWGDF